MGLGAEGGRRVAGESMPGTAGRGGGAPLLCAVLGVLEVVPLLVLFSLWARRVLERKRARQGAEEEEGEEEAVVEVRTVHGEKRHRGRRVRDAALADTARELILGESLTPG